MPDTPKPCTVHVALTTPEIRAVMSLIEDQIFRVKFIDPKMPGYRKDLERVQCGESALAKLRVASREGIASPDDPPAPKVDVPAFHLPLKRGAGPRGRL